MIELVNGWLVDDDLQNISCFALSCPISSESLMTQSSGSVTQRIQDKRQDLD